MTDPNQAAMAALASAQQHAAHTHRLVRELCDAVRASQRPPRLSTHVLTQVSPTIRDEVKLPCASIGLLNPNPVVVYIGVGGGSAQPGARAIVAPANSALVLPISAEDLELGVDPADPDLAAGDAVVHLLRFEALQPLFLGAL